MINERLTMDDSLTTNWFLNVEDEIQDVVEEPDQTFSSNPLHSQNLIIRLTFEFALEIVRLSTTLEASRQYVLARQVLKSGTSIGANVREAQHAESKADFIHKMKIAAKEAEETDYWLLIFHYSDNYPTTQTLQIKLRTISKILNRIINTSKNNNDISFK
ncbi:MAG: four helix bundle protein [Bacteroidia bacterium]